MKTILFEELNLSIRTKGITVLEMKSHRGKDEITLSPRELDILIALLTNHRVSVKDRIDEERARDDLERELKKKADAYRDYRVPV